MAGALNTTWIVALLAVMALRPPMPRHSSPFNLQFALGWWINEVPLIGLAWLIAGTASTLAHPRSAPLWWLTAGLATVDVLLLARIAMRVRSAGPALAAAFRATYGPDGVPLPNRPAWWRLVVPVPSWRPDVRRVRNRRYGPARRGNRLDVYVSRRGTTGAPVLVYVHGGAFTIGSKLLGARAMLYRLAAQGWVCLSIDHRLFRASYADQLADLRAAVAWARANAPAYGGDPETVLLAGSSSGAHLAATAALSDPDIRGVVTLGGYYGPVGHPGPEPASPLDGVHPGAPPFLIVHGILDTLVLHREARAFADRLRATSAQPVVYVALPAAQHNFDFFHSPRFHAVTDAIVRFTELTLAPAGSAR